MDAGDEGSAPEVTAEKIREGELCNAQAVNPKAACSNKKRPNGCGVTQHLPGNCQRHGMMALQVPRRLGFGWTVADAEVQGRRMVPAPTLHPSTAGRLRNEHEEWPSSIASGPCCN